MIPFVNRKKELSTLSQEYTRPEASFVVIYGRRRVGKTALINAFCKDKPAIFFLATEESEQENRRALQHAVADFAEELWLHDVIMERWEPIFDVIAQQCNADRRLVLVIDEFQYLGKANPAFPSILMRIWDQKLKQQNIMVILCGSLIHMMTSQVLSYDSPLYGRRTAQMKLGQIAFAHYREFMPELSEEEQILRYAVTGGVPKYIELFQGDADIYELIDRHVLSRSAFLYAEPEFLLQKEVSEIGSYFSILKTIAAGNHKLGKIASVMNLPQTSLTKYLHVLMELDIVAREVPVTEENPEKSKKGLYEIKDHFLKFWFRFVYPYRGLLEADQDAFVMARIRNHFIDNHVAYVYEDICRQRAWELLQRGISFDRIGRWWGNGDVEIDIVAYDSMGTDIVFGECKYSVNPKGMSVLQALQEKSAYVDWKKKERKSYFVLYSRSGFTPDLLSYAAGQENIVLIAG